MRLARARQRTQFEITEAGARYREGDGKDEEGGGEEEEGEEVDRPKKSELDTQ